MLGSKGEARSRPQRSCKMGISVVVCANLEHGPHNAQKAGYAGSIGNVSRYFKVMRCSEVGQSPTYSPPVQKITVIPILRLTDICSRQMRRIGTLSMARSLKKLKMAEARYNLVTSRHFPGSCGVQIFCRGLQRAAGTTM